MEHQRPVECRIQEARLIFRPSAVRASPACGCRAWREPAGISADLLEAPAAVTVRSCHRDGAIVARSLQVTEDRPRIRRYARQPSERTGA